MIIQLVREIRYHVAILLGGCNLKKKECRFSKEEQGWNLTADLSVSFYPKVFAMSAYYEEVTTERSRSWQVLQALVDIPFIPNLE